MQTTRRSWNLLDRVTDEVGEDENHPLASLMNVLGVLIEKYEDERVPELTELRRPLREIKIHPAALPSSEAFGLRDVQAATARLGRQENARRFAARDRAGTTDPRMGACVSPVTGHRLRTITGRF